MSAPLHVPQRVASGVTILELHGRLVVDESDRVLSDHVTALVMAGTRSLLLDLRNVTYMDSGGVGALFTVYLHVVRRGGQLKLLCPTERACRVLRVTHLLDVFEVFDSEEQALRSFETAVDAGRAV
jgi:anti-sigma B factor antagonist